MLRDFFAGMIFVIDIVLSDARDQLVSKMC